MAKLFFDAFAANTLKADKAVVYSLGERNKIHDLLNSRTATAGGALKI